jgi:hypothetical protein
MAASGLVVLTFAVVGTGLIRADDATGRDLRLTLRIRQALLQDERLAALNVGVSVRNGVARLWGTLPSSDLIRRTEEQVRRVLGVTSVASELRVQAPGEPLPPAPAPHAPPPPPPVPAQEWTWRPAQQGRTTPAAPSPAFSAPSGSSAVNPERRTAPAPAAPVSRPPTLGPGWSPPPPRDVPPATPGVRLLPALDTSRPVAAPTTAESLPQAVAGLCHKEERFRRVRPEVRGGVVYLHGRVPRWEDLQDLARALARLPGVERVVLEDVAAD